MSTGKHEEDSPALAVATGSASECQTCKFWVQYVNGKGEPIYGICVRFPPASQRVPALAHASLFPNIFEWVTNWPRPAPTDWCAEHKPND